MANLTQTGNHIAAGRDIHNNVTNNVFNTQAQLDIEAAERKKVTEWLFDLATINHYAIHSKVHAKLAPNTGAWILLEPRFKAWLNNDSGTFWGVGIPGAGKTILTSYVINYLQERGPSAEKGEDIIMFVYCRYDDALTIRRILSSLLGQLCLQSGAALTVISESLYRPCMEKQIAPSENQLLRCLRSALSTVLSRTRVIIDALDELREDVCHSLVALLVSLKRSIFLTSRNIPIEVLGAPDITIKARAEGLTSFIASEVERAPKLSRLLRHRDDVRKELFQTIISRSGGMFLLASLQLAALTAATSIRSLRESLRCLPAALDAMYDFTLMRIQANSEEESTLALRAILWVTHALRPLRISELLDALLVNPDASVPGEVLDMDSRTVEDVLISVCGGLLTIETETDAVRLIHFSAHDYFMSYHKGIFKQPHTFVAGACALYLNQCGFFERIAEQWPTNYEEEFPDVGIFARYSCRWLGFHAHKSTIEPIESPRGDISPFLYNLLSRQEYVPLTLTDVDYGEWIEWGRISDFAALNGLLGTLEKLGDNALQGIPSSASCSRGHTPFHFASIKGDTDAVKLLIREACKSGRTEVINAKDNLGSPALYYAAQDGHGQVVQLLLDRHETDVNIDGELGLTALHVASARGHKDIVQAILASPQVDWDKRNLSDETALDLAIVNGHEEVVQLLLGVGANCNTKGPDGETALHLAATYGNEPIAQLLLITPTPHQIPQAADHHRLLLRSPEVALNAKDDFGWSALHRASFEGHEGIVKLLLDHPEPGVDLNSRTTKPRRNRGRNIPASSTAYDIAVTCKQQQIAAMLREKGADTKRRGLGRNS